MAFLDPVQYPAGQLANTEYRARPAISVRNGAVPGRQVITLGGTTNLDIQPYTLRYTRSVDGYSWEVAGMLMLTRSQQTLPLASRALVNNLNAYHDIQASLSGADITLVAKDASVTPTLTFTPPSTLTTATSNVTNAVAPRVIQPGTVVGFSVDPANGEKLIVPVGSVAPESANYGVVLRPLVQISPRRAENVTYDVLLDGTVWMQLYGTAPLTPATSAIQIGRAASTTPGLISVAGATTAQFDTVNLLQANQTLSKFNILDKNVQVGGKFRLVLR